jgi:AcrR family transcriptional regulator
MERREAIARSARDLTAERGFTGFTIEELCEEVGISRRTFFNYFPSKEDAVIGRPEDGLEGDAIDEFVANRNHTLLLDDLVRLGVGHMVAAGLTPAHVVTFKTIIRREPQLLASILDVGNKRDVLLAAIVARREGLPEDHPSVLLAVHLAMTVLKSAAIEYLQRGATSDLSELAAQRLAIARALFAA